MSDEREQRNHVFTAGAPAVDPHIKTTTAAGQARTDFGLDVPVETVPLPSAGRVYPEGSALHNRETVDIKSMTAREEDILTSRAFLKKGTVITELIKSCLTDKSINPIDMLTGDRNALMVAIRITGYGPDYEVEVDCNECNTKSSRTFDLGQLPIERLSIMPVNDGENLFEFVLPYCKKAVRFRFLTGRDEEDILATSEKQKKLGLFGESSVTTNLQHAIVCIDGIADKAKIANFIKVMPARDSLALRNFIRDHEPGIRMKQEVACPSCGHSEEVGIPIGTNFLWPHS